MKHRDYVWRTEKHEFGIKRMIKIERVRCPDCGFIKRLLPEDLLPYRHYSAEIIRKVVSGEAEDDIRFEDYPCDMTKKRWLAEFTTSKMTNN